MSDAKHTPGPWFLEGNWDASSTKSLGGWVSSFPPSGVPVFEMTPLVGPRENICANARLIAAAPDLLAALELALEFVDHHSSRWDGATSHPATVAETARAAIAKAKGQALPRAEPRASMAEQFEAEMSSAADRKKAASPKVQP